jgi:hypothetical protein
MNSIIKRFFLAGILALVMSSCIIQNAESENCAIRQVTLAEITEGSSNDIVFTDTNGDSFYINRGLEQGLDLSSLKHKLTGKKVNLHLYKFWFGTSKHISQLEAENSILYTEFD